MATKTENPLLRMRAKKSRENEPDPGSAPVIEFQSVTKLFSSRNGPTKAIEDVSLQVQRNTFTTVVGPSGCGKTTLLRMCSGLSLPSSGRVMYKGTPVTRVNTQAGYITQDSNLFPWLNTRENIEFSLKIRGVPKGQRRERARTLMKLVGLDGFENHYPHQLSGGMQKRASIARTLIYGSDVILMDEPFGALDAQTRIVLQNELLSIWQRDKKTILFVTHDLTEAITLSDVVILLSNRPSTVKAVFHIPLKRPRNVFEIHSEPGFADLYHRIWEEVRGEIRCT